MFRIKNIQENEHRKNKKKQFAYVKSNSLTKIKNLFKHQFFDSIQTCL